VIKLRHAYLGAALAMAAGLLLPGKAEAQIPVTDAASLLEEAKQLEQDLKSYATQLQQLQQEVQQVTWLANTFESFNHNPSLGGAMGLLQALGIQDPLPVSPYAIQGLLNGQGGISGTLGNLSALSNSSFATNNTYTCTDDNWQCQEAKARANSIAGTQGTSMQIYQEMANHFPVIAALQQRLLTATSPKDVMDAQAQLTAEQAWVSSSESQLHATQLLYQAQADSEDQRQREKMTQNIDAVLQQARDHGALAAQ
jgi:type IV secretion system protein VirB5